MDEPHILRPPKTRRDILDDHGMAEYKIPTAPCNIANVMEGPIVDHLAFVFRQLDEMGAKRAEG